VCVCVCVLCVCVCVCVMCVCVCDVDHREPLAEPSRSVEWVGVGWVLSFHAMRQADV